MRSIEKILEEKFRISVKSSGGKAIKFVSPSETGYPDRLVWFPGGYSYFVEFKDTNKKPTVRQQVVHRQLRDMGFNVHVVDDYKSLSKAMEYEKQAYADFCERNPIGKKGINIKDIL